MNYLIINAYEIVTDYSQRVTDKAVKTFNDLGQDTRALTISEDPLNLEAYREHFAWADHLILIFPLEKRAVPQNVINFLATLLPKDEAMDYDEEGQRGGLGHIKTYDLVTTSPEAKWQLQLNRKHPLKVEVKDRLDLAGIGNKGDRWLNLEKVDRASEEDKNAFIERLTYGL